MDDLAEPFCHGFLLFLVDLPWVVISSVDITCISVVSLLNLESQEEYRTWGPRGQQPTRAWEGFSSRFVVHKVVSFWLFVTPWTVGHQAPLSLGFSRQEYWSGLPCMPPGDLPDSWIEPMLFMSTCIDRVVLYHYHLLGSPQICTSLWKSERWFISFILSLLSSWGIGQIEGLSKCFTASVTEPSHAVVMWVPQTICTE